LTFNHAHVFSDFSIQLRLPTVSIPQTENNLSTNSSDAGAQSKSRAMYVSTE